MGSQDWHWNHRQHLKEYGLENASKRDRNSLELTRIGIYHEDQQHEKGQHHAGGTNLNTGARAKWGEFWMAFFVQHVGPLGIDASKNFSSISVTNLCEAIGAVTIYETQIKSWA